MLCVYRLQSVLVPGVVPGRGRVRATPLQRRSHADGGLGERVQIRTEQIAQRLSFERRHRSAEAGTVYSDILPGVGRAPAVLGARGVRARGGVLRRARGAVAGARGGAAQRLRLPLHRRPAPAGVSARAPRHPTEETRMRTLRRSRKIYLLNISQCL